MEVTADDTLIGNVVFKKLLSTSIVEVYPTGTDTFTDFIYVHELDNKVYSFDEFGGEFLYDFNAEVGDTLHEMRLGGYSPPYFIVDSVGTIDMDGVLLGFQDIKFDDLFNPGSFTEMRVVERIGSIGSFFLHSRLVIQPFDFPYYYPKCYEDPDVGLIRLEWEQGDCEFFETNTTSVNLLSNHLSIAPNPASNLIVVKIDNPEIKRISVVDLTGIIRLQHDVESGTHHIDVSQLVNGLYFISGTDETGVVVFNTRIVKQ